MNKLILFILLLTATISSCQLAEPETFILPFGYKGKVMVVFKSDNGEPVQYENGRRVYKIPSSGILISQFNTNPGFIEGRFIYTDSTGNHIILRQVTDIKKENFDSEEICVFSYAITGVYGNSGEKNSVTFEEFMVSDSKSLNNYYSQSYQKEFDKKLRELVGHDF